MAKFSNNISKKLVSLLILLFIIGGFVVGTKIALAQPEFGLEYATALALGTRDLRSVVMRIINVALGFLGILAIGVILYGGFLYMTSGGSAEQIEKAKKVLVNGAIGLAIILMSYAIAFLLLVF